MKIPEEKIQEVREATDIVEVVSQYVTLKKRGKSYIGLCPFHTEKTPSFSVDPVRGFYHCFGCGVGGNVFTFTMQMEHITFPEAIRSLAEKAGIPLPKYEVDDSKVKEIERLYHANQFASNFFQQCLFKTENGAKVLQYLEKRGLKQEMVKQFQIGYAPSGWDGLLNRAREASLKDDVFKKAGLIVPRKDQTGYYDRFRDRLMFPILNVSGRVVGFGGRILKKTDDAPKYINTPETPIYQKGKLLYGLFQSKAGIQREDRVLLVEGYTDLMQLHQHGFENVVATSGTALTEDQARLIRRYTKNVILLFDADSAGFSATIRGVDILLDNELKLQIVTLPAGSDPDIYLRINGRDSMIKMVESAVSFIDFQLNWMEQHGKLKTSSDKVNAAFQLVNTLHKINSVKDYAEKLLSIREISEKLGIEEKLLREELKKKENKEELNLKTITTNLDSAERGILALLIEGDRTFTDLIFKYAELEDFQSIEANILFKSFHKEYLKNGIIEYKTIMDQFFDNENLIQYIAQIMAKPISVQMEKDTDRAQFGFECLLTLKRNRIQYQIKTIREQIKKAEKEGKEVHQLSKRWIELKKNYNNIKTELAQAWKKNVEI